jgi:hypothetical protein
MRWRVLGPLLGLILLGALVFSLWPSAPPPSLAESEPRAQALPAAVNPVPRPRLEERAPTGASTPTPDAPRIAPAAPPPSTAVETGELDPEVDPEHLKALGLGPEDLEPLDGGPLHALTREGIQKAVQEELPGIRECYEGWLQQNPALAGKMKVEFTIVEIPGRDRAKIIRVEVADGGMGHLAMEGCVRNVFKGMRFEAPKGGELRVVYPIQFAAQGPP